MAIVEFQMKTYSRRILTAQFSLNDCIVHKRKPEISEVVSGRRKEKYFVARCLHDDCSKISSESAQAVVDAWNKWNP